MFIDKIIINNFRVYNGINEIDFPVDVERNVSIVSGNNGFGKTSMLTSLVWCLYGKLMTDVDERYRREIHESGGYKRYCEKIMNRIALTTSFTNIPGLDSKFEDGNFIEKAEIKEKINALNSFSVTIQFTNLLIPSIPCEYVQISRNYNVKTHTETVEIFIDGRPNELTREVGHEIFINDFILPKEIAKFFFFDAEKIVSLAEMRSTDEKRNLSQAYAEVLGIKKYLDLKDNLENLRLRLRKKSADSGDRNKLDKLRKQLEQSKKLMDHGDEMISEKEDELSVKKIASDKLQEQLIREGTSITLDELKDFKQMKDNLGEDGKHIKTRLKDMMELAPFAIAGNKLHEAISQLESEQEYSDQTITDNILQKKLSAIKRALKKNKSDLALSDKKEAQIVEIIKEALISKNKESFKTLLDFSTEQSNRFIAIHENLLNAYSKNFRKLIADLKKQQSSYNIIIRKLQDAESKENDPVIKTIRHDKTKLDLEITVIESALIELKAQKLAYQNEVKNISGQVSELQKKVNVEEIDRIKDETAARLINELDSFILKLKVKKKASLEKNILSELNRLMHKTNFVERVDVVIEGDLIDIELYDGKDNLINKDGLSKGEQQLYATALLKALVDESNIRFPVFIDSPLQKFDKEHARNIIVDFYPNVSGQVILFPLLEKELNEEEFKWLLPRIGTVYLIEHMDQYYSRFNRVIPAKLFNQYRKNKEHVQQH